MKRKAFSLELKHSHVKFLICSSCSRLAFTSFSRTAGLASVSQLSAAYRLFDNLLEVVWELWFWAMAFCRSSRALLLMIVSIQFILDRVLMPLLWIILQRTVRHSDVRPTHFFAFCTGSYIPVDCMGQSWMVEKRYGCILLRKRPILWCLDLQWACCGDFPRYRALSSLFIPARAGWDRFAGWLQTMVSVNWGKEPYDIGKARGPP